MPRLTFWLLVGFLGQALFTARFVVQWLASERERDSVVPVAFWWLSLMGGTALLSYATWRRDPVIIVGQAMGLLVYVRNLMLAAQARRHRARIAQDAAPGAPRPVLTGDRAGIFARPTSRPRVACLPRGDASPLAPKVGATRPGARARRSGTSPHTWSSGPRTWASAGCSTSPI